MHARRERLEGKGSLHNYNRPKCKYGVQVVRDGTSRGVLQKYRLQKIGITFPSKSLILRLGPNIHERDMNDQRYPEP